mgnify:FL=1
MLGPSLGYKAMRKARQSGSSCETVRSTFIVTATPLSFNVWHEGLLVYPYRDILVIFCSHHIKYILSYLLLHQTHYLPSIPVPKHPI